MFDRSDVLFIVPLLETSQTGIADFSPGCYNRVDLTKRLTIKVNTHPTFKTEEHDEVFHYYVGS